MQRFRQLPRWASGNLQANLNRLHGCGWVQAALAAGFIEELPQALLGDLPNVTIADVRDANFTWGLSWNFHPEMMENNFPKLTKPSAQACRF